MRSVSGTAFSGSASTRLQSVAYPAVQLSQAGATVTVSGTTSVLGVVYLEVSYQQTTTFPITLFQPTEWFAVSGGSVPVSGNGTFIVPTTAFSAPWVRLVYEPQVGGTGGQIVAQFTAFGSSASGSIQGNTHVKVNVINSMGTGTNFSATAEEPLLVGMLVARASDGEGVIRADSTVLARMPAIGMVTEIRPNNTVMVQAHGPTISPIPVSAAKLLFVGANGYPAGTAQGITYIQPIGVWGEADTIILSITPTMTIQAV